MATPSVLATQLTSYFIYDESGHVIGEYDANGNPVQEHVYLGDRPVAVVTGGSSSGGTVDYVTTDQLDTPRKITDGSGAVIWSWNSDPFGNAQPTGSITYNLRFPGQYYDAETGHNYNYMRDYDPVTGRYIESDPIGLNGGVNTYAYVGGNPTYWIDPFGLSGTLTINSRNGPGSGGLGGHSWLTFTGDNGTTTSFSTWGDNPAGMGNGMHLNLDLNSIPDATRSAWLNDAQETAFYDFLFSTLAQGSNGWGYFSPCSTFAANGWKAATGEWLSPYGPYSNPSSLINSIISANGGLANGSLPTSGN